MGREDARGKGKVYKLEFIEENGLPHQSADWFAMTVIFDGISTNLSAVGHQISMSLRGGMKCRRGNPHPKTDRQTEICTAVTNREGQKESDHCRPTRLELSAGTARKFELMCS